jgi:hypothetical protein
MHRVPSRLWTAALCLAIAATTAGAARADGPSPAVQQDRPTLALSTATHDTSPRNWSLYAGAGYLGSPGAYGEAFTAGVRYAILPHLALSADLGYGLLNAGPIDEDRWWVIPSVAWVMHAGRVTFDFGGGAGVGTASGYASWSAYFARPFDPTWAVTAPAVRAHATLAYALDPRLDVFVRPEIASLLGATSRPELTDSTWVGVWVGVQTRL